jgi:hypothetical protein
MFNYHFLKDINDIHDFPSYLRPIQNDYYTSFESRNIGNMSFYNINYHAFHIAKNLFIRHLSPSQHKTFIEHEYIIVISNRKHKYRINTHKDFMNIYRIDGWFIRKRRFCVQIHHQICCPHYDHLLAQKLLIESDEDYFLQKAHRFVT